MNRALIIAKHEFFQVVRRKGFYLITLGLPLIAFLGLFVNNLVQDIEDEPEVGDTQRIGYVDNAGMFDNYTNPNGVEFVIYTEQEEARKALLSEDIQEYFIIPEDYLETGIIERFTTERELEVPATTWVRMRDFLLNNLLASEVSEQLLERARIPLVMNSWHLDESGEVSEPPDEFATIFVPYVFGLLFIISIFMTSGYLLQGVAEEKENRIMEILLSSVSVDQLLGGKIVGLAAAGLIQIGIWLVSIRIFIEVGSVDISVLEDVDISAGTLILAVVYFLLGYALFAVIYAGLGAISTNPRESQQTVGIFVMPAVVPLILLGVIAEHPEGGVAQALTFIPITAPTTVVMRLVNINVPPWELALSIVILLGMIGLGLWLAARIFRAYLLMYGKRPSWREILRMVRQA